MRVNAELLATRELLAESTRSDERNRISRDLHDVLGHHLVALSLHLELAAVTEGDEAATHVGKAQALAASLLDDVRSTVHAMRTENVVDALHALAAETPRPLVHVETPPDLEIRTPAVGRSDRALRPGVGDERGQTLRCRAPLAHAATGLRARGVERDR